MGRPKSNNVQINISIPLEWKTELENLARIVLQMACENTKDSETEWVGHSDDTHFEYESLDEMLKDWCKRLKDSEASAFAEEIDFIENMKVA